MYTSGTIVDNIDSRSRSSQKNKLRRKYIGVVNLPRIESFISVVSLTYVHGILLLFFQ